MTPFCEEPGCEWPDNLDDHNMAITDFLTTARNCALMGLMSFDQYLKLCVQFDPADPDDEEDETEQEDEE